MCLYVKKENLKLDHVITYTLLGYFFTNVFCPKTAPSVFDTFKA